MAKIIDGLALALIIIGAINWGLVGSPEVAHSLSGGLGVGSCVASQKRKDPQH